MKGAAVTNLLLLATIQAAMCAVSPDPKTFFPTIKGNLTKINWAHAVNSQGQLEEALKKDDIMMLEADVVMGTTTGDNTSIPIMAHPPNTSSDLSLDDFLKTVVAKNNGSKGIKLDFKSTEAFEKSKQILEQYRNNLTIPVFINADILRGPVNAATEQVDATTFVSGAKAFPEYVLSVGWTTKVEGTDNKTQGGYTKEQVQKMIDTLSGQNVTQPITYPVRAGLAANDIDAIKLLMEKSGKMKEPTLSIWSSEGDKVNADQLSKLIREVGVEKVYVDVPADLKKQLQLSGGSSLNLTSMMLLASLLIGAFLSSFLRRV